MRTDSCKSCSVTGKEEISTNKTQIKFQLNIVKIFLFIEVAEHLKRLLREVAESPFLDIPRLDTVLGSLL